MARPLLSPARSGRRYTFPANSTTPRLVVDITNDGQQSNSLPLVNVDPSSGRVTGGATFAASFGPGVFRAYTCVDFRGVGNGFDLGAPVEYGTYLGSTPIRNLPQSIQDYTGYRSELGALLGFKKNAEGDGETGIYVRVGVSFISPEKACANAEEDIPDFDFEGVRATARGAWNELLGRVQVETEGVDDDTVTLFYTSLYRTHISPADCK